MARTEEDKLLQNIATMVIAITITIKTLLLLTLRPRHASRSVFLPVPKIVAVAAL